VLDILREAFGKVHGLLARCVPADRQETERVWVSRGKS
jgi:hypothetical protein